MATGDKLVFKNVNNNIFSYKNRIINGTFQIWQRGTSASYASDSTNLTVDAGYKTADRVRCANNKSGGQFTISKSEINGYPSLKVTTDTPPDNLTWDGTNSRYWIPFWYRFEGQHLYDIAKNGKNVTISFLFKSNVSGTFSLSLRNASYIGQNGTGDETKFDTYVTTFTYDGSGTPQKIVATIPFNYTWVYGIFNDEKLGFELFIGMIGDNYTTTTLNQWQSGTEGNAVGASFAPLVASGYTNWASTAGNYLEISQLQLEEGDTATDFEFVPYDIELMRCMRYYETGIYKFRQFVTDSNEYVDPTVIFKVNKRVTPTCVINTINNSGISYENDNNQISTDSFKPGSFVSSASSSTAFYYFSWVADAEL